MFQFMLDAMLAQMDGVEAAADPKTRERLILLGTMALVIAALFFWATTLRGPRHRKGHRRKRHSSLRRQMVAARAEIHRLWQMRQRKRKHRRPRFPTLAETGGLPPIRSELGTEDHPDPSSGRSDEPRT